MHAAELVSTGTELLNGGRINTHAHLLARMLAPLGFALVRDTTVRDDLDAIEDCVRQALRRVDLVFVSGGLGPTVDDITRDAVARAVGRTLVLDEVYSAVLAGKYASVGRAYNEPAQRQAWVAEGAAVLPNPVGSAPGQRMDLDHGHVFVLPGPTGEFSAICEQSILPWLRENLPRPAAHVQRVWMLAGLGESDIAARLEEDGFDPTGIEVGYCAHPGEVELRLDACGDVDLEAAAAGIRRLLGKYIFAEARLALEDVLLQHLAGIQGTLATLEIATGGQLAGLLASHPDAPGVYRGGATLSSLDLLQSEFGVSPEMLAEHGAASEAMARHLADAARIRFDAAYGLAVSGVVPDDMPGPDRKAGELFVAVSSAAGAEVRKLRMFGDPAIRRLRAAKAALELLRRVLP